MFPRKLILLEALAITLGLGFSTANAQTVVYVDADAPGPIHDGSSWSNAFQDLQIALAVASSGDEIRVAQGTYTPDSGSGDRGATFKLKFHTALRGGYAGYGAADPDERDFVEYETILSGDLLGNDGPDFANNDENSRHVVTGTDRAILDGFTVTGGNKEFTSSVCGGGLSNSNASPTVTNCIFKGNAQVGNGGAICNTNGSHPTLINCIFRENRGNRGGAIFNDGGSIGATTLINCTFSANLANRGGGIFVDDIRGSIIINCIFWGNADSDGMEESSQIFVEVGSDAPVVMYSLIQGLDSFDTGAGNIAGDPLFGPLFVDISNGDLRLRPDSPAIDAGVSIAIPFDLDGNVRIVDDAETPDTGLGFPAVVDMGAYEFGAPAFLPGDLDGDRDVDLRDFSRFLEAFTGPGPP